VAYTIGPNGDLGDSDDGWCAAYGVSEDGAVLVRPDGHVAWRCSAGSGHPRPAIEAALDTVLCQKRVEVVA
jgi:hypothetical protein